MTMTSCCLRGYLVFAVCSTINLGAMYFETPTGASQSAGVQEQKRVVNNQFEVLGLRGD